MYKQIYLSMLCLGCLWSHAMADTVVASYAAEVTMDGKLEEAAWAKTPAYPLLAAKPNGWGTDITRYAGVDGKVQEGGQIKFLWNEKYFYIGVTMTDSDVVGDAEKDQTHIFAQGDTVEIFIHPRKQTYYWEIFGAVNEKKTCYFFPGRGRLSLPSNNSYECTGLIVKASVDGTLNNWRDRDRGWILEMAVPVASLTEFGAKFDNSESWSIYVLRLNYSRYLPFWETTAFPKIDSTNTHFYEGYATMQLQK